MIQEEFLLRAKSIHGDRYEYIELPSYLTSNTYIKVKCKYHNTIFIPSIRKHIYSKTGCRLCYNDKVSKRCLKDTNWFMSKAKITHDNKYSYEQTNYQGTKQKIIILCPKHGEFTQSPNDHLNGCGCPECAQDIRRLTQITTKQFVDNAKQIHGDRYDYTKVIYEKCKKKVLIICPKHGSFSQTPNSHLNGCGCPICKISKGELAILQYLIHHNIPYHYQKHQLYNNTNLWFDFVINEKLVIELDGIQHRSRNLYFHKTEEDFLLQQKRDTYKDQFCMSNKLPLYRIEYTGRNVKEVINTLHQILQGT